MQPNGRMAEPEDVARAIAFLASEDAAMITGVLLPIDGGWHLAGPQIYKAEEVVGHVGLIKLTREFSPLQQFV